MIETDPEVVGVEESVAVDVLERGEIGVGALGRFAKEEIARESAGQVAAFFVGVRALSDFHEEGKVRAGEVGEESEVEARAQVVGVGNKKVADILAEQSIQPAGAEQRRVEIAVSWRAPFELRLGWPSGGLKRAGVHLGNQALHQLEVGGGAQLRPAPQISQALRAGAETIHEQEPDAGLVFLPEMENLFRDEIQEAQPFPDRQQGFGPG